MSLALRISLGLAHFIDSINEYIGRMVSWLSLFMVLTTFIIVISRYLFDQGWVAMQESVSYMHSLVFMLGMAYTMKHDGHVRVDIFYQNCNAKKRAWINSLGTLFLMLPVCIFIFWSSWEYVFDSWQIKESSKNSGGLPGVYLLKTSILAMAALLILQAIALLCRNCQHLFSQNEAQQ